jgi:hypothetical protein
MKHNYPKIRKKRDVSYSKSYKLLQQVGIEKFKEILSRVGMYKAAKEISEIVNEDVTPWVVRYIRNYKLNEKGNL